MKPLSLVCPVNAFHHLSKNRKIKGSITGKGMHFCELCLFLLFSFIKGIKTASYKQHLFILLTLSNSSSTSSVFKCKVSSTLLWRKPIWNHTSPFLSCLKYISEPCSWIDIHLKQFNHGLISWSSDTQTIAYSCHCFFVAGGPLFESCSFSPDCNNWLTEFCHRAQNNKGRKIWTVSERSPGKRRK